MQDEKQGENKYFARALSNFINDFASGDAIRFLADKGMTVREIHDSLEYPTSMKRVQETVWKHLLDKGVLSLEDPHGPLEKESFVIDRDRYGRETFRRVIQKVERPDQDYIRCDFGRQKYQDPLTYEKKLQQLNRKDREYLEGLPWPLTSVWHAADERMRRIAEIMVR